MWTGVDCGNPEIENTRNNIVSRFFKVEVEVDVKVKVKVKS